MGKPRKSKRQLIRDERRKKRHARELGGGDAHDAPAAKRPRVATHDDDLGTDDFTPNAGDDAPSNTANFPEKEYFGILSDEEQEVFRTRDQQLAQNDFPDAEDYDNFVRSIFKEAKDKELKLASSQSCSRLMERLILRSTTAQKRQLFSAFANHFVTLVTHRFASHCCELLFLQSAPVITQELVSGFAEPSQGVVSEGDGQVSMERTFLLVLDELEEHLSSLLSHRFASHTLRVLLVILSGRPLNQLSTKSLLQSKKKEGTTVAGVSNSYAEADTERVVPSSFGLAIQKIIGDTTSTMDATALRVLATHPTGNPVLQLLLELDITLNTKSKTGQVRDGVGRLPLLETLLPEAPASLGDSASQASEFVHSMLYDPIGSRLLETLITHCPGKIFKGLNTNIFGPRIEVFLRNDIASYPTIKVLNRLSKEDLVDAVTKVLPTVPGLLDKGRFNVLKTLFERCQVRQANAEIEALLKAAIDGLGSDEESLVSKLCIPQNTAGEQTPKFQQVTKNTAALASHGSQLVATLLGIPGSASKAVQSSLLTLPSETFLHLATSSTQTAAVLVTALKTPSRSPIFHKSLVASLLPHTFQLAGSQFGHNVLIAIIAAPSKGADGIAVPFHLKEAVMSQLAEHEAELCDGWTGPRVWRICRGDLWRRRRTDWVRWAKEVDPEGERMAKATWQKDRPGQGQPGKKTFGRSGGGGRRDDVKV